VSSRDRPVLDPDDPAGAPGAVATRRGYCWWDVDHAG
jgi:hypothetical protein